MSCLTYAELQCWAGPRRVVLEWWSGLGDDTAVKSAVVCAPAAAAVGPWLRVATHHQLQSLNTN